MILIWNQMQPNLMEINSKLKQLVLWLTDGDMAKSKTGWVLKKKKEIWTKWNIHTENIHQTHQPTFFHRNEKKSSQKECASQMACRRDTKLCKLQWNERTESFRFKEIIHLVNSWKFLIFIAFIFHSFCAFVARTAHHVVICRIGCHCSLLPVDP